MATIYTTDGNTVKIFPNPGPRFSLEEMQNIVGGYIELISLKNGYMIVNEEGKIYNLPYNEYATDLAHKSRGIFPNDYIVGNVLVCSIDEID